ncbi:hypothetical protein [Actinoplanes regularis]|uniref:Uncharacterized protein n=1 Tax=Actinoplanes regularis TaxID=52697 RepID=A0A238V9V9_9ACTN|nr:hypothetical protein [Actinoplanes regularis]GIE83668.1 hypothetical protein Are01nite_01480 [Actinoplanes regularis]SNR31222.1 hypothetical protein SAMN06264365_101923 [Actinoplanes regularis]
MAEPTATRPRVVLLTLTYKLPDRVQSYISDLTGAGVRVDLLVTERRTVEDIELDEELVKVHHVFEDSEMYGYPLRWVERRVLFDVPTKVFTKTREVTRNGERMQVLDKTALKVRQGQAAVSQGVHHGLFWPVFQRARPLLLMSRARKALRGIDVAGADRIVAADSAVVPLAWRLAKRYPNIQATTALDRKPWVK